MTSQPPLLDSTGSSLPGPQFTPRPGWGGQLRRWFVHNVYIVVFRMVLVVALVLIVHAMFPRKAGAPAVTPTSSPENPQTFIMKANPGDGMTNLAARTIDLYVAVQSTVVRLDAAQHLFAVDTLAHMASWSRLEVGQSVPFTTADISSVLESALKLSPARHAAWARLLRP